MNPRIQKPAKAGPTPAELLAKMPRRPMTPEQQTAALEKVQQTATQRVKLGQQLFEAAEAKLKQHQKLLSEINQQQDKLREQVQDDVAKSLQSYDQWMGQIDESFTKAITGLGERIDSLETRVNNSQQDIEAMISKAAALLEQTQGLLAEAFEEESQTQVTYQAPSINAMFNNSSHIDEASAIQNESQIAEDGPEILEVEIVDQDAHRNSTNNLPLETDHPTDGKDVFGEVLRRLRSQSSDDDHAAA